jgi:serine/threonine protein kinase
VYEGMS